MPCTQRKLFFFIMKGNKNSAILSKWKHSRKVLILLVFRSKVAAVLRLQVSVAQIGDLWCSRGRQIQAVDNQTCGKNENIHTMMCKEGVGWSALVHVITRLRNLIATAAKLQMRRLSLHIHADIRYRSFISCFFYKYLKRLDFSLPRLNFL